jgi:hypothetical protein
VIFEAFLEAILEKNPVNRRKTKEEVSKKTFKLP